MNKKHVDVAVIGGGPAGLSAAYEAAVSGASVCLIDENKTLGGQLFKQIHKFFGSEAHNAGTRGFRIGEKLLEDVVSANVDVMSDAIAWGITPGYKIGVTVADEKTWSIEAKKIIVATGAAENILSFPGSTLSGVIGAGAAQTMMNIRKVRPGSRAVIIGSGNVGLIVSYQLLQAGVDVVAVVEAAPAVSGYLVHASKIKRAGVNILTNTTVLRAIGKTEVEAVEIADADEYFEPVPGTARRINCDLVGIAVGLHPLSELCWMMQCDFVYCGGFGGFVPRHDADMQTSRGGIYIAGDVAGIEEASVAIEEGRLAGVAAAEALGYIPHKLARELKGGIWDNLRELRSGSHGAKFAELKKQVMGGTGV